MIQAIVAVWTSIMDWFVDAIGAVQEIFYASGSLTFIGTLSVIGVAIAITLLVVSIIKRFLSLRS